MSTINTTNLKNPSSGSNNVVLNADGTSTLTPSNIIKSGTAVASTSGTSIDFTGIPSWVKRITVMFAGVSTSGTSSYLIQVGAGSVDNTGYISSSLVVVSAPSYGSASQTAGFLMTGTGPEAAALYSGSAILTLLGTNTWTIQSSICSALNARVFCSSGSKALSGTLDRVRISTVNGTDTFDAGTVNILYEG